CSRASRARKCTDRPSIAWRATSAQCTRIAPASRSASAGCNAGERFTRTARDRSFVQAPAFGHRSFLVRGAVDMEVAGCLLGIHLDARIARDEIVRNGHTLGHFDA